MLKHQVTNNKIGATSYFIGQPGLKDNVNRWKISGRWDVDEDNNVGLHG